MRFRALFSTDDGRITKGFTYFGGFVMTNGYPTETLKIVVFDNQGVWKTFEPKIFEPW